MPGTYSQISMHVVFATMRRTPWLTSEVTERLYPFIGGIVRDDHGVLLAAGGVADHVHLYLGCRPDQSIATIVRNVKSRSTSWLHRTFPSLREFRWQSGYSVFSVSHSLDERVRSYIGKQAEHHRTEDFRSELSRLLRAHGIDFDVRYAFE